MLPHQVQLTEYYELGPPLSRTMCFTNSNRSSTHATMLLEVDGLMLGKKMLLVSTMCSMSCPVSIDVTKDAINRSEPLPHTHTPCDPVIEYSPDSHFVMRSSSPSSSMIDSLHARPVFIYICSLYEWVASGGFYCKYRQ